MSFKSKSSQTQARSTVNKLFANILPGSTVTDSPAVDSRLSSTEIINNQMNSKHKLSTEEIKKINKANKIKKNKAINKKVEANKKFNKLVKYNIIKNHKLDNPNELPEEERKYLQKLVKKNSSTLRRLTDIDDPDVKDEIDQLKAEILELTNEKYNKAKASKNNKLDKKSQDFNEKVKKGLISTPGLTPGLAPVGLDDDSDEE